MEQFHLLFCTTFSDTWPEETHFHIIRAGEQEIQETPYQPSLFEQDAPQFDPHKTSGRGKIFVLDHDIDGDGRIDFHDLEWRYLDGDGDYRSEEVTRLRDEADIIVTNPPFSLFREFLAWIVDGKGARD